MGHKVRIYREYHSVPLVGIGTFPTPLSPASMPLTPEPGTGAQSPAGEELGESQFRRLDKKLRTLWDGGIEPVSTKQKSLDSSAYCGSLHESQHGFLNSLTQNFFRNVAFQNNILDHFTWWCSFFHVWYITIESNMREFFRLACTV
jgi:hypothetical protein